MIAEVQIDTYLGKKDRSPMDEDEGFHGVVVKEGGVLQHKRRGSR